MSLFLLGVSNICGQNLKNSTNHIHYDSIAKNEVYQELFNFNQIYRNCGKEIFYTKSEGYEWFIIENGERNFVSIPNSLRLSTIESGLNSVEFRNALTSDYYNQIFLFKKSLNDPINIGYVMTQHELGKSLLSILSERYFLNLLEDYSNGDPSQYMSEQDYIDYHKERIHIVNENKAIFKNLDSEISLGRNFDVCYFLFIKENKKWLLDGIEICTKDQEEAYDIKIIGEYKPIEYYEAEEYNFPE